MSKVAMVVDDSISIRKLVGRTLKAVGFDILEAANGKEAIDQLGGISVQLVITDLNMPVMDGLELIRAMRELPGHKFTPVVFLTTENETSMRDQARAAGATAWLVKPFHPDKVMAVVDKITQ